MAARKKGYKEMVDEALTHIVTLSVDEAKKLHGDSGVVFVDLRDPRELEREGLIPNSFHAPRWLLIDAVTQHEVLLIRTGTHDDLFA